MDHSKMAHYMTEDGVVMVMSGIPGWMFGLAVGLVIVLSFVVTERRGVRALSGHSWSLTPTPAIHRLVRKRWFQFAFQAPVLLIFLFVCYAGLFGNYARNITPVIVWTIWWAGLIFAVAMFGNLWCFMCPWDALANLASRLSFWKRTPGLSLGWRVPPALANLYPALALFVGVTWLELGWGITNNPRQTAIFGLAMAAAAVVMALLFEKKAFCAHVCLVGRVSGMYSNFSPVEIRPRDTRVCGVCTTRDCLHGNERGYACPTGLDLGTLDVNTHCTLCTECFKSCPTFVPHVRLRAPGADLSRRKNPRRDEAWFALVLLALTGFHGLSMTPLWQNFAPGTTDIVATLQTTLGVSELAAFTVGMAAVMVLPVLAYVASIGAARAWVRDTGVGFWALFDAYAWSVLPVALFYHLAHNAMHLFMEGQDIVPLLSDPLGRGSDWFGTASWHLEPLLSEGPVWVIQVLLILVGHVFGVVVAHRISRRLFADAGAATRSLVPPLVMMVLLSVAGLWLMHLDMNMRMGRM
ncbi:MAG: 4Fe-4S binding protein [Alphaproteobacteria bacterium]|nr:4Fe-4S binding protein [Alphaproteobacteria bacterium]